MLLQVTSNFLILLYHRYADTIYHFTYYAFLAQDKHTFDWKSSIKKITYMHVYCMFLNQGPHRYI